MVFRQHPLGAALGLLMSVVAATVLAISVHHRYTHAARTGNDELGSKHNTLFIALAGLGKVGAWSNQLKVSV